MKTVSCALLLAISLLVEPLSAASFQFGRNANGLTGLANATLSDGGFDLQLEVGPDGALFNENESAGLGVDTSGIEGVTDGGSVGDRGKINIIDGTAPVSGTGEFVTFSFDKAGILETLLFDGVKDETLEYFTVEFPDAAVVTFFDSQTVLRLTNQGFTLADLGVPNPTIAPTEDDDFEAVDYAFSAGEQFTVTYGEIDFNAVLPGYVPRTGGAGNGARFEGIVVRAIPEPSAATLACFAAVCFAARELRARAA